MTACTLDCDEIRIDTPDGQLFATRWTPARSPVGRVPIVLFHESLGAVTLWRDLPANLARSTGRTVIAYDRLGFGRSDAHPGRLSLGFVTEEARTGFRALRAQLSIGDFIAYGHSTGGSIAAACAAEFPAQCRALVMESAHVFVEPSTLDGIRATGARLIRPDKFARLTRHHGAKVFWVLDAWVNTWLDPAFANWNLDDALDRIACPVLVVQGDNDPFASLAHAARVQALVKGPVAVSVMKHLSHVPHAEAPDLFLETMSDWLRANDIA